MPLRFVLKCDFEEAPRVWDEINDAIGGHYSQDELNKMRLGLTELINNVIQYAFPIPDDARFSLRVTLLKTGLFFGISHQGCAFTPPDKPPGIESLLGSRSMRGRGLFIIANCFTEVRYRDRAPTQRIIARF